MKKIGKAVLYFVAWVILIRLFGACYYSIVGSYGNKIEIFAIIAAIISAFLLFLFSQVINLLTKKQHVSESNTENEDTQQSEDSHSEKKDKTFDIDNMDGYEFEEFCAILLNKNGFENVRLTKESGDQGVDILAEKDGIKYAIQCKCYSSDLGNKPVQEVYAGQRLYQCQIGAVITNRYFTAGGREAASATGVLLWDRRKLQEFIEKAGV